MCERVCERVCEQVYEQMYEQVCEQVYEQVMNKFNFPIFSQITPIAHFPMTTNHLFLGKAFENRDIEREGA